MPVVTFEINQLTIEQKKEIVKEFTEIAARVTGIPNESFYVFIRENTADNIGVGGVLQSELKKREIR